MNRYVRSLLGALLIAVLCLALPAAQAEEECLHRGMSFRVVNNGAQLTQQCMECGHEAFVAVDPLVVMEGEDYPLAVRTGGDPWLGEQPGAWTVRVYAQRFGPGGSAPDLGKPTGAGSYYLGVTVERRFTLFAQLTIVSRDHVHDYGYSASENTITARCGSCGMTSVLTLTMSNADAGCAVPAVVTTDSRWPAAVPQPAYYTADDGLLSALPQEPGEYYAAVAVEGQTAVAPFTIMEGVIEAGPIPAGRILTNKPYGMVLSRETIRDGLCDVVISKAQTDWSAVIAQLFDTPRQMTIWQTPHVLPYPGADGMAHETLEVMDDESLAQALERLKNPERIASVKSGEAKSLGFVNIGRYTPENGLFIPGGEHRLYTVFGWYQGSRLVAAEILERALAYDDKASFVIRADSIPAADLIPAVNIADHDVLEYAVTDGSVSYRADDAAGLGVSVIETGVQIPQDVADRTAYCEVRRDMLSAPVRHEITTVSGRPGICLSTELPAQDSAVSYGYTLTLFDEDGQYVKAYNVTVSVRIGELVPFPLYHDDWSAIPRSRLTLQMTNESGKKVPNGFALSYNEAHGIVNYGIDSRRLPRGQALGAVVGTVSIEAPEGAAAYRMYPAEQDALSVRPDIYSIRNDDSLHAETRIAASPMVRMTNGYDRDVAYHFLQGREIRLIEKHPYILYALGLPYMGELGGGFRLIYWYADEDDETPMLKEYLLVTHDPASAPSYTAPVSNNSDLPDEDAALPRIIISSADGRNYAFYSDVVPQTSDDELHYELRLIDAQGNTVPPQTLSALAPMTICIPVPDGVDASDPGLIFTVSHLNADSTRVEETFSYEDGTLELTEHGLCFDVESLSPFVLSWDAAAPTPEPTAEPTPMATATPEPTAEPTPMPTATPEPTPEPKDDLPQTGDGSSLLLWCLLLAGCLLTASCGLRRSER